MRREFRLYPKYKQMYIHAFDKMVEVRKSNGKQSDKSWTDGEAVFNWWLNIDDSQTLFEGFDLLDV